MSDDLQFVDTNVLIYAHDRSAGNKHIQARKLLETLWIEGNGCLSIQVLQEFYINVTRKIVKPLTIEDARTIVADLSVWVVHTPQVEDVLAAIDLQQRYTLSFWDAMILTSAAQLGCTTLWSEDLSDGQDYDGVTVTSPFTKPS